MSRDGTNPTIEPGRIIEAPGSSSETSEVMATPDSTGDRYQLRMVVPPGGGPGVKGLGPHVHPAFTEVFRALEGSMLARLGSQRYEPKPGEDVRVAPGTVHGFTNIGEESLVREVDLIFAPPGPRQEADLVLFSVVLDELADKKPGQGTRSSVTQMARVLRERFPEAMTFPGIGKLVIPALAFLGRLQGLPTRI